MQQHNEVRSLLERDEVAFGANVETGSPRLVELYGDLGFDWVWLDMEHKNPAGFDAEWLEHRVRAAECADTELLVRVPTADPAMVRKVLDTGVRNILVPRVRTAEITRQVVRAAHFRYDDGPGERGLGKGRSSSYGDAYGTDRPDVYPDGEDDNVLVGVLLEHHEAVEDIAEITAVPDLGFVLPGFGDLSVSLDRILQYDDQEVIDAIERIESACVDADVPMLGVSGGHFDGPGSVNRAIEDGYQLLGLGHDFGAVRAFLGNRLEEHRSVLEEP